MIAITAETTGPSGPNLIAPAWHTWLLASIFAALTLGGAFFQHHAQADAGALQQHPNVIPLYLSLLALEWGLFLYVRKGLRFKGFTLRELIGWRWTSGRAVLVDLGLAVALWILWAAIGLIWNHCSGPAKAASLDTLLPRGALETVLWIAVSISAGICEELTFRGYFQQQFAALTHSRRFALLIQALLFGIGHGYQGVEACARIALLGLLYGVVAQWRSSLRPGMIAHASSDIISGIFGI